MPLRLSALESKDEHAPMEMPLKDENRRWELVESHWDLPIGEINPHAADD
jgi:hypothetical protein